MSKRTPAGSLAQIAAKPLKQVYRLLPESYRDTVLLRTFGLLQVPLLFFVSPKVIEASEDRCVVQIPLNRRTKNHLGSMYFGALSMGADCAGGLIAMRMIEAEDSPINLIFKDFEAHFLKRAEGDVHFVCEQGQAIRALVQKATESGERENMPVHITALVPSQFGTEPVATFVLTLSLKRRS